MNRTIRFLSYLAVGAFLLWSAALAFLYFNQDSMIFPVPAAKAVPAGSGFEPVVLATPDNQTLNALVHPAEPGESWVIAFHGNGGDVVQLLPEASVFEKAGFGVLIAEYRGYNGSSGAPSMTGLYADALTAFDHVKALTNRPIHLYAHSLGTAMAIHVAQNKDAGGVALLAPFDSVLAVAQARYPILPLQPFLKHPFPSVDKISDIEEPIVIYHGDADQVVPIAHGRALHSAAPDGTEFIPIDGADHNGLYPRGVTDQAAEFFSTIDGR